jgi:hypothetical protein
MLYKGKVFKYQWKNEPQFYHDSRYQCFVTTVERRVTCSRGAENPYCPVDLSW